MFPATFCACSFAPSFEDVLGGGVLAGGLKLGGFALHATPQPPPPPLRQMPLKYVADRIPIPSRIPRIAQAPNLKTRDFATLPQFRVPTRARNILGIFSIFVCKSFAQKPGSLKNLGLGFWFLRHVGRGRYGHLRDML
jgi:hypothetical protein